MSLIELFLIAVGLSMDAFAVSVCKGLATQKLTVKHPLITGLWFGGFQALMPTIGYLLGSTFEQYITSFDHWIAFVLLCFIGFNMIRESREKGEVDAQTSSFAPKTMLLLAIATSIDALAVGIGFASLSMAQDTLWLAVALIGIITSALSPSFFPLWALKSEMSSD